MKDNARHLPGSTRSCRPVLPRSPASIGACGSLPKNRSKISPKSVYFRICEFLNHSALTTYNLHTSKRSDFPAPPALLAAVNQSLDTGSPHVRLDGAVNGSPFSLGAKVRVKGKLVTSSDSHQAGNKFSNTVQSETK